VSAVGNFLERLDREEAVNACSLPQRFSLPDAGGVAFGLFFLFDGVERLRSGSEPTRGGIEVLFGSVMMILHAMRFHKSDRTIAMCRRQMCGR